MDEQRTSGIDRNKETEGASGGMTGTAPNKPSGQDRGPGASIGASIDETIEQVKTMARNAGEQAWSAASSAGDQARSAASTAGETAQDLARKAREQASAASDTLYEQGSRAARVLSRNVDENPLTALLIAGAIGYMAAYLLHARGQSRQ
jgi:ElaB/YqjD/DUF883 family membrane-anchored ribosome-binding protein